MQASDRVLAGRYASALFQAAAHRSEEQKVAADLGAAQKALIGHAGMLRHPRVTAEDKKKLVKAELEVKISGTTLRFLELLVEKKRWELLPMVAVVYGRLAMDKRGAARAIVKTARALSSEAQKSLTASLKKFTGKDIELDVKEDPELIGGVTVKIGDWVLDSSIRGQLRRMKESIQ